MKYKRGDIVTVEAEVCTTAAGDMVELKFATARGGPSYIMIPENDIDRLVEKAPPEEPSREAILKSKFGALWTWSGRFWVASGSSIQWAWGSEFFRAHGPFTVFNPDGEIK